MKHRYYGIKRKSVAYVGVWELDYLERELRDDYFGHREFHRREIEKIIKQLKDDKDTRYVYKTYEEVDKKVFISQKYHTHVCDVGETIRISDHEGKIRDRKFDAEVDTMHYYTNIIVVDIDSEDIDKQLSRERELAIEKFQKLLDDYFPRMPRVVMLEGKEKGFWSKLF